MALQPSFSSSSSSSSFGYGCSNDVFLSFRGTDTRYGFTGNLYKALCDKGIHTFIDDEELQRGEEITPSLVKAIQESRIAIPVFSANYASSSFCLDELAKIMECFEAGRLLVLPVFYEVDPSHVRHQRGSYGEAMTKHEERFKDDTEKVKKWREALRQVANLSGYDFTQRDGYDYKFIGEIVGDVSRKIKRAVLHVADYPVGLESRVSKVTLLMDVGSNDGVHMVGIHGIGGIGKTTLALAVYKSIADHFDCSCFLENVRENSNRNGLAHLQKIILSELFGKEKMNLASVHQGISVIQHRLQKKKVLLILDDVDSENQLEAIVGKPDWFGLGSRVIITTRDVHLLKRHGVEKTYEVEELNNAEALKLLSLKAFETINVDPIYMDVLNRAVTYACGLPLALVVMGSNLFKKGIKEWESALNRYEKIPNSRIHGILKVSFDALEKDEQDVFLDIACCFKGCALSEIEDILHAHYESCMKYHIEMLVDKSLIKISYGWAGGARVMLHDLIEDMGKEIVRQESPKKPGKRSRLWFHEDIIQVLQENQGTAEIEMVHLQYFPSLEEEEVKWDGKAFKEMKNLKTLIIEVGLFSEGPKYLPNSLRVLKWWRYPSPSLPSDFHPKKLSIFKLPHSCCTNLPSFLLKQFMMLTDLSFDYNKYLTELPDVSGLENLEKLSLRGCKNLTTIHSSVGFLAKLKILSAFSCEKLRSCPPLKLPSLETLELEGCMSLEIFPEILGKMKNITRLNLGHTCIEELPSSIQNLTRLRSLSVQWRRKLMIPTSIVMMPELTWIALSNSWISLKQDEGEETVSSMVSSNVMERRLLLQSCNLLDDFFPMGHAWFANVTELDLSDNNFTILPECIRDCRFLRNLNVNYCQHLQEIKGIPPNLEYFSAKECASLCTSMLLNQELHKAGNTQFILPHAMVPEWFEHCSTGPPISFWFRNKLPAMAVCLAVLPFPYLFSLEVIINGNERFLDYPLSNFPTDKGHTYLFDLQNMKYKDNVDEVLLENEWNYAEVSFAVKFMTWELNGFHPQLKDLNVEHTKQLGIHVFEQRNTMDDIRFTNPYTRTKLDDGFIGPES